MKWHNIWNTIFKEVDLGPSIEVGPAMRVNTFTGNSQVLNRYMYHALNQGKGDNEESKEEHRMFM